MQRFLVLFDRDDGGNTRMKLCNGQKSWLRYVLMTSLILFLILPNAKAYGRSVAPLSDPTMVKEFQEGRAGQLPDGIVSLYVLRNDRPLRGVTVTVCTVDGEELAQYGTKKTDPSGAITFMVPRDEQFILRMHYDAVSFRFDKYTDMFRAPTNLVYETNLDQKPQFIGIANQEILEGSEVTMHFLVRDPEDEKIMVTTAETLPAWVRLEMGDDGKGTIIMYPGYEEAGMYSFTFTATEAGKSVAAASGAATSTEAGPSEDKVLATASSFMVSVIDAIQPPRIEHVDDQMMSEGEELAIMLTIKDEETHDAIAGLTVKGLPAFAALKDRTITFKPGFEDAGDYHMKVVAVDKIEEEIQGTMEFKLKVLNVQRLPLITTVDRVTVAEGAELTLEIAAHDPDGIVEELAMDASHLPHFAVFTGAAVTLRPEYDDSGDYDMCITAAKYDADEILRSEKMVHIKVNDMRQPVKITPIPDQTGAEGDMHIVDVNVFDPEPASRGVQVDIEGLPEFGIYELDRLVFQPGFDAAGTYPITVSAYPKGDEASVSTIAFTLTVLPAGRHTVAGWVTGSDGPGVRDVSMRVDKRVVCTDIDGRFALDRLIDGTYIFEPRRAGYVFEPERREIIVKGGDVTGCDFEGHPAAFIKITQPEPGIYVAGPSLKVVQGIGSIRIPDRVVVNGVEAFFDADIIESVNNSYSFIADNVPVEFNAEKTAFVEAVAYDVDGRVLIRDKVLVREKTE
jgi:hypothetical protein